MESPRSIKIMPRYIVPVKAVGPPYRGGRGQAMTRAMLEENPNYSKVSVLRRPCKEVHRLHPPRLKVGCVWVCTSTMVEEQPTEPLPNALPATLHGGGVQLVWVPSITVTSVLCSMTR